MTEKNLIIVASGNSELGQSVVENLLTEDNFEIAATYRSEATGLNKTYLDVLVTLTDPSSNSPGLFTFNSSNNSVATINNNIMTIFKPGTATITATQGLTSNFNSRDISATLIVEVCFPANTPILTDQGIVLIQDIDTDISKYTIQGKNIIAVSKMISSGKSLVCFEQL